MPPADRRATRLYRNWWTIGFITPMTHNFCESVIACGLRVRARCTCALAKKTPQTFVRLFASEGDDLVADAIDEAIGRKPKGHDFIIDRRHQRPGVGRRMSVTGG